MTESERTKYFLGLKAEEDKAYYKSMMRIQASIYICVGMFIGGAITLLGAVLVAIRVH